MPGKANSDWRIIPLLIVVPWTAVFIAYQTGVLRRIVEHFDQSWAMSDPQGLSFLTRISLENFLVGDCDSGLFFLKWVEVGASYCPFWVQGEALACLEAAGRDEEAQRLLHARCSEIASAGDVVPAYRVNPDYPRAAIQDQVAGWVELAFDIADDGRVSRLEVRASDPPAIFDQASMDAVTRWRYCPGTPASDVQVRLVFEMGS